MSNETTSTNRPPLKLKGGSGRYRKFSLITYLHQIQIELVLCKHCNQIRAYAYAYHDMDTNEDGTLKEPHIGIARQRTVRAGLPIMVSKHVPSQAMHLVKKTPILERKLSIAVGVVGSAKVNIFIVLYSFR